MPETLHDMNSLAVSAVFAHPDDEGFAAGGTLAMLAAGGARISLVCATPRTSRAWPSWRRF